MMHEMIKNECETHSDAKLVFKTLRVCLFKTALEKFLLSRTRYQNFSNTFTKIELSLRDRPQP